MNILLTLEQTPSTVAVAKSLRERLKEEGHLVTVLATMGAIKEKYDIGVHIGHKIPSANFRFVRIAPNVKANAIPPTAELLAEPAKRGRPAKGSDNGT